MQNFGQEYQEKRARCRREEKSTTVLRGMCKVRGTQSAQENVMGKFCEKEYQNLGFINVGSF
jgi:hypothetical protein